MRQEKRASRWLQCSYFTNRGLRKSRNEDALLIDYQVIQDDLEEPCQVFIDSRNGNLFAVADGLGAHDDAQLASRLVIAETAKRFGFLSGASSIEIALEDVNRTVYRKIQLLQQRRPMGAVMAGVLIIDDEALVFSVGDCVIYFADTIAFKVFVPERTPDGKSVTDCFGGMKTYERIMPAVKSLSWLPASRILIATDGLYDSVSEDEILNLLLSANCDTLSSLWAKAMLAGANDNLSMILVQNAPALARELEVGSDRRRSRAS